MRAPASKIRAHDIRTPSERTPVGKLSGGNIQKVLLARELGADARVAILNKPTYGLDLHNQRLALERIDAAAARGVALIVISTDLDELLEISDRIGVMFQGRLAGIVDNAADAERKIGALMTGAVRVRELRDRRWSRGRRAPSADTGGAGARRGRPLAVGARQEPPRLLCLRGRARHHAQGRAPGDIDPDGAASLDRRGADRGLPGRHLESGRRRSISAGGRDRGGARAGPQRRPAAHRDAHFLHDGGRAGGRDLVADSRDAQGALRRE